MKKLIALSLLGGMMMFISSCSLYQIDSQNTTDRFYPPKDSIEDVTYIYSVTQPYDIIGQVIINAERRQSLNEVIEKMKYEASIIGGDAITNIRSNSGTGRWAKMKPQKIFANANIRSNFIADVIVFKTGL